MMISLDAIVGITLIVMGVFRMITNNPDAALTMLAGALFLRLVELGIRIKRLEK